MAEITTVLILLGGFALACWGDGKMSDAEYYGAINFFGPMLVLAIALFIFWFGMKFGEVKENLRVMRKFNEFAAENNWEYDHWKPLDLKQTLTDIVFKSR